MHAPRVIPDRLSPVASPLPERVDDELDFLLQRLDLAGAAVLELGCGNGEFSRRLAQRCAGSSYTGLEADRRQHERNLASETAQVRFLAGEAQSLTMPDGSFDAVLMLKSLHHVPHDAMGTALTEASRVLRPGGYLYVSEPRFEGAFNEIIRLFNDEQVVRRQAQAAVDRAVADGQWLQMFDHCFESPARFTDFEDFRRRLIDVSFQERRLGDALLAEVRARFEAHMTPQGAPFARLMRARLLRKALPG